MNVGQRALFRSACAVARLCALIVVAAGGGESYKYAEASDLGSLFRASPLVQPEFAVDSVKLGRPDQARVLR